MTDKQLQKLLKKWQKILYLRDWEIRAELVPVNQMPNLGQVGEVEWDLQCRAAHIRLVQEKDYPTDAVSKTDFETTLVHELLHLHLAPIHTEHAQDGNFMLYEEQAINTLAKSLIKLHRKG